MAIPNADLTKINEVIGNLVKTRKIFTAYNVTTILRRCNFHTAHGDVQMAVKAFDLAKVEYVVEPARNAGFKNNAAFKVIPNIYFHKDTPRTEVDVFEQDMLTLVNAGITAPKVNPSAPIVGGPLLTLGKHIKAPVKPVTQTPVAPVVTKTPAPKQGQVVASVNEILEIKPDLRNRCGIPSKVIGTYFNQGDRVGVYHDPANKVTVFERFIAKNESSYATTLTVDKHKSVRIREDLLSYKNGKVAVEYVLNKKQIQLREV